MMIVRLNLVSFLLIIISLVRSVKSVCDSTCISSLSPDDCPVGTFFEVNITMNDCCPGCRTGIGLFNQKFSEFFKVFTTV